MLHGQGVEDSINPSYFAEITSGAPVFCDVWDIPVEITGFVVKLSKSVMFKL